MENEVVAEENIVISDEMDKVTVYKEEQDEQDEPVNEHGIDTSSMPPEVKKAFEMMADTLKTQNAKLDELRERESQVKSQNREVKSEEPQEPPKLRDQFKFEEGDYYAKFLLPLADAIDNVNAKIQGLSGEVIETKKTTFEDRVKTFFDVNKVDKPIVKKMDEIASRYGGTMYNDLPNLLKYAKAELGITDTKKPPPPDRKNVIEQGKMKKTVTEPIRVNSMKDAFKKALKDLED